MNVNDKISLLQLSETSLHPVVCLSFSGYQPSFKACQSIKLSGQECQIGFGLPQGLSQTFRLLQSVWMPQFHYQYQSAEEDVMYCFIDRIETKVLQELE